MATQNEYSVVFTRQNGAVDYYARGLTLDVAQTIKAELASTGTITIAITGSNGFQGGGELVELISNPRVVRSFYTGSSDTAVTAVVEEKVPTTGQRLFSLGHIPLLSTMTVTVASSSARPDVMWQLLNHSDGTPMLLITAPLLSSSVAVSASYSYQSTNDVVAVTGETPTGTPNGVRTTYTTAAVYAPGTLTATHSATGTLSILEGGGNTFEALVNGVPLATGDALTIAYSKSSNDNQAIPASETFSWTRPSWCGTPLTPGQTGYSGG